MVGEEALLQWAAEKEHADPAERVFLEAAQPLIDWLRQAESGSSSGSGSEEEEGSGSEEGSD